MSNKNNNQKGFSLIEMLTAITLFAMMMSVVLGIFQKVLSAQSRTIGAQAAEESIRYNFELMSRELRMAKRFSTIAVSGTDSCESIFGIAMGDLMGPVDPNRVFHVDKVDALISSSSDLYFKNSENKCVHYFLDVDDKFKIRRVNEDGSDDLTLSITPNTVKLHDLRFEITDTYDYSAQPRVTVIAEYGVYKPRLIQTLNIQTTITPRYYSEF